MDFTASPFEIKTLDDAGRIEGIAAGFGNVDHGGDKILFGAFTKTLAARGARPLPMLHSHDMARPIGSWTEIKETPAGLSVAGKITLATRDGAEAYALARDGALGGISIGWKPKGRPAYDGGTRVIPEVELFEASLVAVPMNDQARIHSLKAFSTADDFRDLFREAGLSSRLAKVAAGAAWKAINDQSDEPDTAELAAILTASAARIAAL